MQPKKGIRLQLLISIVIFITIALTVTISWFISIREFEHILMNNQMRSNDVYVDKLANITEHHLDHMLQNLIAIANIAGSHTLTQNDIEEWFGPNQESFNSIFVTAPDGVIELITPEEITFKDGVTVTAGLQIETPEFHEILQNKQAQISEPYRATSGQLITLLSAPIFDHESNEYLGVIAGTIHIESENVLNHILSEYVEDEETYVYVVDHTGKLIYHPKEERLLEDVTENEVVQQLLRGKSGSQVVVNTEGKEFLASYTYVPNASWGIVSQTSTKKLTEPLPALYWRIVTLSLPFIILILLCSALIVSTITKPIKTLATFSDKVAQTHDATQKISLPKVRTYIYEIRQLYNQVSRHLQTLKDQASLDGLTGIRNRRLFDEAIVSYVKERKQFTLIVIDIDYFKKVNDTFGHAVGDDVLRYLANEMKQAFENDGVCYRYGGEEFVVLLPDTPLKEAYKLAETFREKIAKTNSPCGRSITVSLGMTALRADDTSATDVVKRVDDALYEAKQTGRNKTVMYT